MLEYTLFFTPVSVTMFSFHHVFEQVEPVTDYLSDDHERWLKKYILLPYQNNCTYARGILFFGPSGSGKTMCVHAFAKRLAMPVLSIACQETVKIYTNNVTVYLQSLFAQASETQSILHLDGIEALVGRKNDTTVTLVNTFKAFMQQYSDLIVIGTTTDMNLIDPSIRNNGQFNHEIYFDYPSLNERVSFLNFLLNKHPYQCDVASLALKMEKFTVGDIAHAVDMAVIHRLSDSDAFLRDYHFDFQSIRPVECDLFLKWDKNVNIMLFGKNTYKTVLFLKRKLDLVYEVKEFPVVQNHFKFYIVQHIGIYKMPDVVNFLEWCSLNKKIVIATSFGKLLMEAVASHFIVQRHIK